VPHLKNWDTNRAAIFKRCQSNLSK